MPGAPGRGKPHPPDRGEATQRVLPASSLMIGAGWGVALPEEPFDWRTLERIAAVSGAASAASEPARS